MFDYLKYMDVVGVLNKNIEDLADIVRLAREDEDYTAAEFRFGRWRTRAYNFISEAVGLKDADAFNNLGSDSYSYDRMWNFLEESRIITSFLVALTEEISKYPDYLTTPQSESLPGPLTEPDTPTPLTNPVHNGKSVFLVHGHDDVNLLRLDKLLRDQCGLETIVLKYEPGQGRTLIEKFEDEASKASFAFALLTPDDSVETSDGNYTQSRPNVVFELGWFYGRLGREKVCILSKKGTEIHSDLSGINRVEFNESVEEAFLGIEKELAAGGLIKSA